MHEIQTADRIIKFDGVELGGADSAGPAKPRWFEAVIYKTFGGKYVVELIAHSDLNGETNRHTAHVLDAPEQVINALELVENDSPYITWVGIRALDDAALQDENLRTAWQAVRDEYVNKRGQRGPRQVHVQ